MIPAPGRVKSDICKRSWSTSHGRALADHHWVRKHQCPAVPGVLDFWDTAGQERFRSMHASYYHQAHACIMVFDVQRKVTYKNLNSWYKELREFRPEIPCIVVANKIDADMKVTQKSFNFARKFSLPFYFVSAADGTNVVKLFNDAIRLAVAYKQHSGDFMDEVLRELESFDLQNTGKDLSNKGKSCTEEEPSSA
ncbi:rab-like protein 2A isoform X3 [Vidua chalybeata]|uniref:rab-like protein 2A isoform X3 n=1 Tax=Vidua chalybeata TaxID=81927 RepID=UPI0023A90991|nr:rab-like protein 2A isoform X3 [Vidua chalybeata]